MRSFYGRSEEECRAKHADWMAAHPDGPPTADEQATVNQLLLMWHDAKIRPPRGKVNTSEDYARKIRDHIEPTIGQRVGRTLKPHDVDRWVNELFASTDGAGRTVEKCLQILRAGLEYAVDNGLLSENPARKVRAPAYEKRRPQHLTIAQFRAFLDAASGQRDVRTPYRTRRTPSDKPGKKYPPIDTRLEAVYVLLLFTGLRRGEVLALRWGDLRDGWLHVTRQIDNKGREHAYTKTDDSRRAIELSDLVLEMLSVHQSRMQAEPHDEARKPDGYMFPTSTGQRMLPSNLNRHFKHVLAAAGLPPDIRIHDLRHTAGSTAAAAGVATAAITAMLGHSSTAITQKLYIHEDREGTKRAMEEIERRTKR